ncbi:GPP34 family phosphoprotein [Saccharopolyspora sp. NPDC049426]|uniref:GPP34 family phosphoprotein n=1 Tax=Saccharopolyspora sp. NPDC049426 TaxID=3155652 RepID=UPI00343611AB
MSTLRRGPTVDHAAAARFVPRRTAALIAVLSASGVLLTLHPAPKWSCRVAKRAEEIEQGSWGASAVNTAVARTAAVSVGAR